jgi:hypothetical protein
VPEYRGDSNRAITERAFLSKVAAFHRKAIRLFNEEHVLLGFDVTNKVAINFARRSTLKYMHVLVLKD